MGFGKYYSFYRITSGTNENLMTKFRNDIGDSTALIKKMTLIAEDAFSVSINGGVVSEIYRDADGLYKLSFDFGDVLVDSIIISEALVDIFLAGIY